MPDSSMPLSTLQDLLIVLERSIPTGESPTSSWKTAADEFSAHANERRAEFLAFFDGHSPDAVEFYERIAVFSGATWGTQEAQRLIGAVWALALQEKTPTEQVAFLDAWFEVRWNFFDLLRAMPSLVAALRIPPCTAEPWFLKVYERVKNDGANAPLFQAIAVYAQSWPEEALVILEQNRPDPLSEGAIVLIGTLSAGLYDTKLTPENAERRNASDLKFSTSRHVSHRRAAYQTRRCRLAGGLVTDAETAIWLGEISAEVPELRIEGFGLAWVAASRADSDRNSLSRALEWIEGIKAGSLTVEEKTHLLAVLGLLLRPDSNNQIVESSRLYNLLQKLLPIPQSEKGTLQAMDHFLRTLLNNAPFHLPLVLRLLASDPDMGFTNSLRHNDQSSALQDAFRSTDRVQLVSSLCFSNDGAERELGLVLFEKAGLSAFSPDCLASLDERTVLLSLYQFQRMPAINEFASRFLLALLPRVRTCNADVQREYYEELLYQAKNLPKACLELIRKYPEPPTGLQNVISTADEYFNRLRDSITSPVGQMSVPGLQVAIRLQGRRLSAVMSESMRRASSILQLFHNVRVIYGHSFSNYREGAVSPPTPMQEFRREMEIPRFLVTDPEGSAMRRLNASMQIANIERQEG